MDERAELVSIDENQIEYITWKSFPERNSHDDFLYTNRNWPGIEKYWGSLIAKKSFSPIFQGDQEYGITNLNQLEFNREKEFDPKNTNEKRKTFAFVLAYDGTKYSGFQFQKGQDVKTVEGDLEIAFGRKIMASGRTDKDVSALSQVVSFSTFEDLNEEELLSQIRSSEPFTENRLGVWQCVRVPRRFHPVFCATWRRYLFLFPVNSGPYGEEKIDVDLSFVNRSLAKITNKTLPFNGFAHRDDRTNGDGLQDFCILFRASATLLNLPDEPEGLNQAIAIELVGSRFLRRMVRIIVATVIRESVFPENQRDEDILIKIALTRERCHAAFPVPGTGLALCGVGYTLEGNAHINVHPPMDPNDKEIVDYYEEQAKVIKQERRKQPLMDNERENDPDETNSNDGAEKPEERKKRLNRRERFHQNKRIKSQGIDVPTQNLATPQSFLTNGNVSSFQSIQSIPFVQELVSHNQELLFFPQRLFEFSFGNIVLSQSVDNVGTTIWDAEVIIAHYLDRFLSNNTLNGNSSLIELGAGTGLAGMVAGSKKLFGQIILQEIEEVLPSLLARINEYQASSSSQSSTLLPVSCLWGTGGIHRIQELLPQQVPASCVIMADVFYHAEHFPALLETILSLLSPHGNLILAFEQRRKDLSEFLLQLRNSFVSCDVFEYDIIPSMQQNDVKDEDIEERNVTKVYICHFKEFRPN